MGNRCQDLKFPVISADRPAEADLGQGLAEGFRSCYDNWQLPSEEGIPWAVGGREIDLQGYEFFPSRG